MPIKNTLLTLSLALAVTAPAVAREEAPIIYSNMTTTQMSALFKNVGLVMRLDYLPSNHSQKDTVAFRWYDDTGKLYKCFYDHNYKTHKIKKTKTWPAMVKSRPHRTKHPVMKLKLPEGYDGYGTYRYDPAHGELKGYSYYKRSKDWKSHTIGHLQKRIPAVVYKLCPKFPSAKSLGAEINHKQTSDNYFELLKQDPGERIKRPDLVTEDPVIRY